ncbi:thiol-disulfide oxidoreductase [Haematobacter massiliensis]|uniref:Thiol-disulfide oxidoreductase n=2 Tax=Haematobacter massiliensis TaxID=195105 RepID=A0A086XXL0_9RHOB|nr:DsbA family protein [Haematobacter massiliensis]KFI26760.1 thiol-disulfide oxidoreductase [Haematobacter massiliensis]OWJ69520.1 thiol-disulfide oxidoreductase [Haematobacter massiliensis]OWJ87616.1 thiol-disulfide oxidoreductase [Haematobacter massiliensis]QBJ23701.1 DsbA family protein [Haematobacter massiliensis]
MTMKTTLSALAMATLAGAFWLGASALPDTGAARAQAAGTAAPAAAEDPARDIIMGNVDAPVTIIEYASFTCPHCAAFSNDVFPEIKKEYIDTGKVKFIQREVYFNRYDLWAAMVARCGGDMRYYGFSKTYFAKQRDWAGSDDPAVVAENLRGIARAGGLNDEQVNACLNDQATAEALVKAYSERAQADGINSTPTFIINGEKHNNMSLADMKAALDKAVSQ